MRLAGVAILLLSTAAAADSSVHVVGVQDPSAKLTADVVSAGVGGLAVTACELANKTVVAWVVYERGKAATVTVGGRGAVEDCVASALRRTTLETGASRVGVAFAVAVTKPAPATPKVALLSSDNKKLIDDILAKQPPLDITGFTGIKGDTVGFGPGRGTGVGGGGTGTAGPRGPDGAATVSVDSNGLTADEIDRVIVAHAGVFRACYQKELSRARPDLAGKIVVRFTIAETGAVEAVAIESSTMHHKPVEDCLKDNVLRLKFPAKARAVVRYPFVFQQA